MVQPKQALIVCHDVGSRGVIHVTNTLQDLGYIVSYEEPSARLKGLQYDMLMSDEFPLLLDELPASPEFMVKKKRGGKRKDKQWDNTPNYNGYKGRKR